MHKAFDTFLQTEVFANLVAYNGCTEAYRYECSCCGEEVYIAATFSTRMIAHFRHRISNNNIECENYLGRYGVINENPKSKRKSHERVEFYYNSISRTFNLVLRFSKQEIQIYEQKLVEIEIRTNFKNPPFRSLKINRTNFSADASTQITLDKFSYSYYLSNTLDGIRREYVFFKPYNVPSFFKLLGQEEDFNARLVSGNVLYTNTPYFVAFLNKHTIPLEFQSKNGIEIIDTSYLNTANQEFLGLIISITRKTQSIDQFLNSMGFQLESSETLMLLWPPTQLINEKCSIDSDFAYIYSSFELHAHGNTNLNSTEFLKISQGISRVTVNHTTKISNKNAQIIIDKITPTSTVIDKSNPSVIYKRSFETPDNGQYFVFNSSGVSKLSSGQVVYLTPSCRIVRYSASYPIEYIYLGQKNIMTYEMLFEDILSHYKRMESFDYSIHNTQVFSKTIEKYIEICRERKLINPIVKRLMDEGLI